MSLQSTNKIEKQKKGNKVDSSSINDSFKIQGIFRIFTDMVISENMLKWGMRFYPPLFFQRIWVKKFDKGFSGVHVKIFKSFLNNANVESFISRQDLPELYCTSGGIYGRTFSLLKTFNGKNFCFGNKPYGIIVNDLEAVNIDRPIDFEFANYLVKNKKI